MIVPESGLAAMITAMIEIRITAQRLIQNISFSLASPLRTMGLYTSAAREDAADSICADAVDMDAARMAASKIPEITAGKIARTIRINTREFTSIEWS